MDHHQIGLEEFVKQTLVDLTKGIIRAKIELEDTGKKDDLAYIIGPYSLDQKSNIRDVNFDLSISYNKNISTNTGFSIFVAPFGGGMSQKDDNMDQSSSRIQFTVPLNIGKISYNLRNHPMNRKSHPLLDKDN